MPYLYCRRCGLEIKLQAALARIENCPRCLSPTGVRERRGDLRRVVAELDVRGEFDEHASMCLRHAIDQPAGLATRIVVDLRDLTTIDRRGLQRLDAAVDDGRARETSLTLLLCGGAAQAAIADAFVAAGLPVELSTGTPPPTEHSGRREPDTPRRSRGERRLGANGGVARWRSRVLHVALRAREIGRWPEAGSRPRA